MLRKWIWRRILKMDTNRNEKPGIVYTFLYSAYAMALPFF